jgi:hypothetical protein
VKIYVGVEVQLHTFLTLDLLQDMETYLLTTYAETLREIILTEQNITRAGPQI